MKVVTASALLFLAACTHPARPAPEPSSPAGPWAVAWERTVGTLGTQVVFTGSGELVSSGARFDADGHYLGELAMHVPGGRMISELVAVLRDGTAVAAVTGAEDDGDVLYVGRADQAPEQHTTKAPRLYDVAVAADGTQLAGYDSGGIEIRSLPDLKEVGHVELAGEVGAEAIGFGDDFLAFGAPDGLAIHDAAGTRVVRAGELDGLAFASTGDVAVVHDARGLEIVSLPDGASRGRIALDAPITQGMTSAGAIAIAPGGGAVAAVTCKDLTVWTASDAGWQVAYRGTATRAGGEDGCLYPSGLAFSPDGGTLAMSGDDLTVLRPGAPRAAPTATYAPALPDGWEPSTSTRGDFMPPAGSGLSPTPAVLGAWESPGALVRAVARDASEMSRFDGVDAWADALVARFDPIDPTDDGVTMPYRRAYVDGAGRRVLEYTILVRGGCDEMDRHVRWVETGDALLEIDIEAAPGEDAKTTTAWMHAFFDAPLDDDAPAQREIAGTSFTPMEGGC